MPQHVTALEVCAVAGFLEDEILREMLAVVAHVQPREEDILRAAARRDGSKATARARPGTPGFADPKDAELPQLLGRERLGRTRVAPVHVPRVLGEEHAH